MRPIDFVEPPRSRVLPIVRVDELGDIINTIFGFVHEDAPDLPPHTANPKQWLTYLLELDLYQSLYTSKHISSAQREARRAWVYPAMSQPFYVNRDEYRTLREDVDHGKGLTLLIGQAGAGKSTLLGKLADDLKAIRPDPNNPFEEAYVYIRLDFTKTSNDLHAANDALVSNKKTDNALLILRKQVLCRRILQYLLRKYPDVYAKFPAWLIQNAACGEAIRMRIANLTDTKELADAITNVQTHGHEQEIEELNAIVDNADINNLLDFLQERFRVVLVFDNVDRWSYPFQQLILQLAIDLHSVVRIVLAIRSSNIERLEWTGKDGNSTTDIIMSPFGQDTFAGDVFIARARALDRLREGLVDPRPAIEKYQQRPSMRGIPEGRIRSFVSGKAEEARQYLEQLLTDISLEAAVRRQELNGLQKPLAQNQQLELETMELLQRMNLGGFSEIVSGIVGTLKQTWVDEQIFHFNNNSIRHALIFYGVWFKSLVIGDDPAFWYPMLITRRPDGGYVVNQRMTTNFVYKKMLVTEPSGTEACSDSLMCLFDKSANGIVALPLRVLEAICACCEQDRNRYWDCHAVNLGNLEDHFLAKFGSRDPERRRGLRDELYNAVDLLQQIEAHGHLGLIWCADANEGDYAASDKLNAGMRFVLTPSGQYVARFLSIKREFLYWNFCHARGMEWDQQTRLLLNGKRYCYTFLQTISEEFRMRAAMHAASRYLSRLFSDELVLVRKHGGDQALYGKDHLYVRILESLSRNINDSEAIELERQQQVSNGTYHAMRDELSSMAGEFSVALTSGWVA